MSRRYPKPAALTRLAGARHAVIEASAGTGKTYTLEHLVVDLVLEQGATIDEILVVTFTEKATAELTARVREKLHALYRGDFEPAPASLPDEACWHIDEQARGRLGRALRAFDGASISTIHAFCQRVLVENAFANRRLFDQTQVEGRAAFSAAFKETLRRELAVAPELRRWLDAWLGAGETVDDLEQLLYACHDCAAELAPVLDGERLAAALDAVATLGLDPGQAAALELPGQRKTAARHVGTVLRIAAAHQHARDLTGAVAALDEADPFGYLHAKLDGWQPRAPQARRLAEALRALDQAAVPLAAAVAQTFLPRVQARLGQRKRDEGLFDFKDMLELVDAGLQGADGARLRDALRHRYRHALIDEFQDTDEVQWRIFASLFLTDEHSLFLIGDPKQAIYGFRGADVQTYLEARERVGRVESLTQNFRSTEDVIEACNTLFAGNFFTGEITYDHPVTCGRPGRVAIDGDGRVAPVTLWEVRGRNGQPLRSLEVRARLGAAIAAEIRRILDGGMRLGDERVLARDIFVLTRTGGEGYEVGRALREAGVPHAYYKQDGLFQTDEAAHVLAVLRAVDDPHDRSRRYQAWTTPFFGVPLDGLVACEDLAGTHPLVERLFAWRALAEARDYEQLFAQLVEESGVVRRALFSGEGERALTNYQHIFEHLLEQAARTRASLRELTLRFGSWVEQQETPPGENANVQRLESERDAVQIMTMHKSKGLEASVVFLYGGFTSMTAGWVHTWHDGGRRRAFVSRRGRLRVASAVDRERREEDQRLLYVALTRARAKLYLPWFEDKAMARLDGCYAHLNARLGEIAEGPLFERRPLPAPVRVTGGAEAEADALARWRPPAALLDTAAGDARLAVVRGAHAGPVLTSYSRMKAEGRGPELDAVALKTDAVAERVAVADDDLPPGPATGLFLHELLERADLATLDGDAATWAARPEVRALAEACARRHDREPRHATRALDLVHRALTTPLDLAGRRLALGRAARVLREVEFVFPFSRGFVKGIIDLVVEHEGLVYLADWKSDLLPSWDAPALRAHVDAHYRLQARLYALALVKLLRLRDRGAYDARFGGLAYCFLRGLPEAVVFERPGWDEILAWQEDLDA